jgi:hypothetical protein
MVAWHQLTVVFSRQFAAYRKEPSSVIVVNRLAKQASGVHNPGQNFLQKDLKWTAAASVSCLYPNRQSDGY